MHPLISAMLAVNVAVMQVVNVVGVQHRFVSTPWTVGVTVVLGLCVLHSRHGASLSSTHPMLICAGVNVKMRFDIISLM
jgi:hypothetical protein